jgi:hypothetical protein
MKKYLFLISVASLVFAGAASGLEAGKVLVLDDFEGPIVAGQTIAAGAGNGSSVQVAADPTDKRHGDQSLKIEYDAASGGYIWVARGYDLGLKGAALWTTEPQQINWSNYAAISFYLKGTGSGSQMAFDIKDAGGEMLRFMVKDDSNDWKQVVCPFDQFFSRGDWQSPTAEKNGTLDFPIKSFQFEPIAIAKGVINIDEVSLEPLN